MPFKSTAQQRYLFKFHPKIAKRWAREYGVPKNLPRHVSRSRGMREVLTRHTVSRRRQKLRKVV